MIVCCPDLDWLGIVYGAVPFVRVTIPPSLGATPSTSTCTDPVGRDRFEVLGLATVIVTFREPLVLHAALEGLASWIVVFERFAPVLVDVPAGETRPHLLTSSATSSEPHPVARSYPVPAVKPMEPPLGQLVVPTWQVLLLFPLVTSWNTLP